MPAVALRPRSATEIVDAAFRLLRTCYTRLAALTAVILAPYILLVAIAGVDPLAPVRTLGILGLQSALLFVAEAAVTHAASEAYLEGTLHAGAALRTALRRTIGVIGAQLIRGLFILVAVFITVIVGAVGAALAGPRGPVEVALVVVLVLAGLVLTVYLLVRTQVTVPALILEPTGPAHAVQRSWRLTRSLAWHAFWAMFLAWLIYLGIFLVLSLMLNMLMTVNPTASTVLSGVVAAFAYPLIGMVTTLLYYDLRVRREGFDLERMARELGTPDLAPAPAPPAPAPPPPPPLPAE